jgi:predicted ATPase
MRRWSKAKAGEGQVVLLSGEAGIGKSRLTAALLECLATEPHTRSRYYCSPQRTDSALYPIISQMERAAGLAHDDTAQTKLDKLDALLAQTSTSKQGAVLFAEMLSLPNDGRYPALDMDPQQRRQKTLEALTAQMEALSRQNPLLMIFEDAHWTDPTSLETFGRFVDRVRSLSVLLIVTFRPEFEPPWIGQPYVTALTINRLAQRDIEAMIDRVVGNKLIPASVRTDIIERTDGIPLFVEEMTKAVLEAESEGEAQRTAAAIPAPALAVPPSLQASLMARLDRLGAAREVAQIGAAIGREFSLALLGAVISKPEADLGSALERLVDAGLLFRQGVPPHATYLFKHALVQDAAYGTLLREPRRALHARIAETLEGRFADLADTQPELPAHHYTEAKQPEKAIPLWQKAGGLALQRMALIEAIAHLNKGMGLIAALSPSVERDGRELDLRTLLGPAWMALKGWAAQEVWDSLFPALGLANSLRRHAALLPILWGLFIHAVCRGRVAESLRWVTQAMDAAETYGDPNLLFVGHYAASVAYFWLGDPIKVQDHAERVLALYNEERHAHLAHVLNNEPKTASLVGSRPGCLVIPSEP